MLGKRKLIVKFFDLFSLHTSDTEFGIFLVEVANLTRQLKGIQLFIKVNDKLDMGYIRHRLESFLRDLRLPHEKFLITPNGSENSLNFVCYTVSLKRKFLGLLWI